MSTVGAFEAKTKLSELLDLVERGEEITITRRGTPVARLVPIEGDAEAERLRSLVADIRETRKGLTLGGGISIKELIEEGRRYRE